MTPREYETILNNMTEEEFAAFRKGWGGEGQTPSWYVDDFLRNRDKHEALLCHRLGVPTEEERRTQALSQDRGTTIQQNIGSAQVVTGPFNHGGVTVNITVMQVLQALQKQIEEDKSLNPVEKRSLLDRLKSFLMHPYVANLATSMIWDGTKVLFGGSGG